MPAQNPFLNSGRPLAQWFPPPDDYGTDPDAIDPASLPQGWNPVGAALLGGNVTRSPVDQAKFNLGLQDVVQQAQGQQQANQFFQQAQGLDTSTPEGIGNLERLVSAFPQAASHPAVREYIQSQRQARQLGFIGGRNAPLPAEGQQFLTRLYGFQPNDTEGWNQLQKDVIAHPEWISDPRVANDYRQAARDRFQVASKMGKAQMWAGAPAELQYKAALSGINEEEIPLREDGSVNTYKLTQMIGDKQRGIKSAPKEFTPEEQAKLYKEAEDTEPLPTGPHGEIAKANYLKNAYGEAPPGGYSPEQWSEAYNALIPKRLGMTNMLKQYQRQGRDIDPYLLSKFGLYPPGFTPAAQPVGPTAMNMKATAPQETLQPEAPPSYESLAEKMQAQQNAAQAVASQQANAPVNATWATQKSALESALQKGFSQQDLPLLYRSIANPGGIQSIPGSAQTSDQGQDFPSTGAQDLPADIYALQKAGIDPNGIAIPAASPIGRAVTNQELLRALAQDRLTRPRPSSGGAERLSDFRKPALPPGVRVTTVSK